MTILWNVLDAHCIVMVILMTKDALWNWALNWKIAIHPINNKLILFWKHNIKRDCLGCSFMAITLKQILSNQKPFKS